MKKLYRSKTDRKVCGVCGGVAEYLGCDATVVRLVVALVSLFSSGLGVIAYIAAAVIIPEKTDVVEAGM